MKAKYIKAAHRIYELAVGQPHITSTTENRILAVIDRTFDPDELDNIDGLDNYPALKALIMLVFDQYEFEQFDAAVTAFYEEFTAGNDTYNA